MRWGDYPRWSAWAQSNHKAPYKSKREARVSVVKLEDGALRTDEGYTSSESTRTASRNQKKKGNGILPYSLQNLYMSLMKPSADF